VRERAREREAESASKETEVYPFFCVVLTGSKELDHDEGLVSDGGGPVVGGAADDVRTSSGGEGSQNGHGSGDKGSRHDAMGYKP